MGLRGPRALAWKLLLSLTIGPLILIISTWLWIDRTTARRWAHLKDKTYELLALARSRDASRPILRGEAIPGNAWDQYSLAYQEIAGRSLNDSAMGRFLRRDPKENREEVERIVAECGSAIEYLQKGARRAQGQYPYPWETGAFLTTAGPQVWEWGRLGRLAFCAVRIRMDEGKIQAAVELLLDSCQFARDLGFNSSLSGEIVGNGLLSYAFNDIRELLNAQTLDPVELLQLDRALKVLDRQLPRNAQSLMNEALRFGFGFIERDASGGKLESIRNSPNEVRVYEGWRKIFPLRLAYADAFELILSEANRCSCLDDLSWADVNNLSQQVHRQARDCKNRIIQECWYAPEFPLTSINRVGRESRTRLRLLRFALHYLATGEILDLEDPFGDRIQTAMAEERIKVWSVGRDGKDHGGVGDWDAKDGKDIVLEVER